MMAGVDKHTFLSDLNPYLSNLYFDRSTLGTYGARIRTILRDLIHHPEAYQTSESDLESFGPSAPFVLTGSKLLIFLDRLQQSKVC